MKDIEFKDLKINDIFFMNNVEYKKIPEQRVSCCKAFTASLAADPNQKIMVKPQTMVQVND